MRFTSSGSRHDRQIITRSGVFANHAHFKSYFFNFVKTGLTMFMEVPSASIPDFTKFSFKTGG
jgi:hypothetical protein